MKTVTFPIEIDVWNEIEVNVEVTEKDYKILEHRAALGEEDFDECERLEKLYQKVLDAALDEMANGIYADKEFIQAHFNGVYEFETVRAYIKENYDITARWPDDMVEF